MRLRLSIGILVLSAIASCGLAQADDRTPERVAARLTYTPDSDVERCPSEREVRDAVAARLGYDPFDGVVSGGSSTTRDVIVVVHKDKGTRGIVGSLEIRGPHPGERELASPDGDCREVMDAFAVAIAIGLDPGSLTRPPPPPPPPPAPPAPPPPPPIPPERLELRLGGGPVAMFGELPSVAPALAIDAAVRWRWFEPTIEGLASLPVSESSAVLGTVKASLLAVTLLPCAHRDRFFACVGGTLGSLHGEGQTSGTPLHGSELYAAVSARAGAELPLTRTVWIRGDVEAVAPITRISLQLASQDVWRMPAVAARVGASLGVLF